MREFSFVNAWGYGVRFFSGRGKDQFILLALIGVLVPFFLQYLLVGGAGGLNPATMGGEGMMTAVGAGALALIAMATGYVLQVGSYFASWHLGFGRDGGLPRAILFGLPAGLVFMLGIVVLLGLFGFGLAQLSPFLGVLAAGLVLMVLVSILFTTATALLAAATCLALALAMAFGTATGDLGFAATMVGGSGFIVVILIVVAGVLMWLAGRFSCTTAIMAERRSYNLFAAMGESWRLTWEDEWRIMRYLALLGFAMAVVLVGGTLAAGAGLAVGFQGGGETPAGIGAAIVQIVLGIPFAYLTVMVPAGIYRELIGAPAPVEVFA